MKKSSKIILSALIVTVLAGIYYYIELPAINIHSADCWFFVFAVIAIIIAVSFIRKTMHITAGRNLFKTEMTAEDIKREIKMSKSMTALVALFVILVVIFAGGSLLSSPIINASKYQQLMTVEEGTFTDDIKPVNYTTIPIIDKDSAALLGDRKMGSMADYVSQFEVSDDYAQVNYQEKPVRVAPLRYAGFIKWLTNQAQGIPSYMMVDMTSQDTECVKPSQPIKYSKSEYFNRNIYRHLRFKYPTHIFDDQIFFEVNEEGIPYWVCPVKKFTIGLFGGQTVGSVVLCNASTGECTEYDVKDVPKWVDKVYSAELLMQLYDYSGTLKHGFLNSILGQKDCLKSTNGYNYIALDDDVWVYTGVTSVNGDQSNVGFVLMNQRTMETKYYKIEGAIEDSAMSSAEGQVQNLGYKSTFPLLLNIDGEPTYFMSLKDGAGLVKKYAMVNVQKYQLVSIGDTVQECEMNYQELMAKNGIIQTTAEEEKEYKELSGKISSIAPIVVEGTTHYYICLENNEEIFDFNMSDNSLLPIIKCSEGRNVTIKYEEGNGINKVSSFTAEEQKKDKTDNTVNNKK